MDRPTTCRQCGYDMTGLDGRACPECGVKDPLATKLSRCSLTKREAGVFRAVLGVQALVMFAAIIEFVVLSIAVDRSPSFPWSRTVPMWAALLEHLLLVSGLLGGVTMVLAFYLLAQQRNRPGFATLGVGCAGFVLFALTPIFT